MRWLPYTVLMAVMFLPIQGRERHAPYIGGPVDNPRAHTFLTYMARMGQRDFGGAWKLRYGIARREFLIRSEREWNEYHTAFRQSGFTFSGWRIRVLDIEEDAGGNLYVGVDQIFVLEHAGRRLFRHAGILFRVTFVQDRIHTIDPIRGLFTRDDWQRGAEGS